MEPDLYRAFKAFCNTVDLPEYVVLQRSFLLAKALMSERMLAIVTDGDRNVLTFGEVLNVVMHDGPAARESMHTIDALATWMRKCSMHISATASASPEDFPALKRRARTLDKDNPLNGKL